MNEDAETEMEIPIAPNWPNFLSLNPFISSISVIIVIEAGKSWSAGESLDV